MNKKFVIFLILGVLIYFIDILINEDENSKDIFISDQEINSLVVKGRLGGSAVAVAAINAIAQEKE